MALFRLNAIECCVFRKSAYLVPLKLRAALFRVYTVLIALDGFITFESLITFVASTVQCMFCFKARALILQLIIAIQL